MHRKAPLRIRWPACLSYRFNFSYFYFNQFKINTNKSLLRHFKNVQVLGMPIWMQMFVYIFKINPHAISITFAHSQLQIGIILEAAVIFKMAQNSTNFNKHNRCRKAKLCFRDRAWDECGRTHFVCDIPRQL